MGYKVSNTYLLNYFFTCDTPAQELLRIVPSYSSDGDHGGHSLEIDAGLLNKDIGFVHTGQIAEIKVDSFPFTKYGVIDGEVTDISADAIEHEQLGLLFLRCH